MLSAPPTITRTGTTGFFLVSGILGNCPCKVNVLIGSFTFTALSSFSSTPGFSSLAGGLLKNNGVYFGSCKTQRFHEFSHGKIGSFEIHS